MVGVNTDGLGFSYRFVNMNAILLTWIVKQFTTIMMSKFFFNVLLNIFQFQIKFLWSTMYVNLLVLLYYLQQQQQ